MNQPLDVYGQQSGLNKLYTQICLCFPLLSHQREIALHILQTGLQRLTSSVPWLAGEVVRDQDEGLYTIRSREKEPTVVSKYDDESLPSMAQLRQEGFSARLLDENVIAPCRTIRAQPEQPAPVFLVQANFVDDGLLLVLCGLHSCMDMTGQGYITTLLAKACRGGDFCEEEIHATNFRGCETVPLLSHEELSVHHESFPVAHEAHQASRDDTPDASAIWAYAIFSDSSLAKLKSEAIQTSTKRFISTDDCLSALLWQSITRVRSARFRSTDIETAFTRTVDARAAAGMPLTYTGNAAVKTACKMTVQELLDAPLGLVAGQLRGGLKDTGSQLRLEATLLSKGKRPNKPSVDPSTGVNLSSWAKDRSYELDFGPALGRPEAVRRPTFAAWESLVYLMPKKPDGEIAVALCLRNEDLRRLKEDVEFAKYAEIVG